MDLEIEKIKIIRDNLGIEYNTTPTFFLNKFSQKDSIIYSINTEMAKLEKENSEGNIEECLNHAVLALYYTLDAFTQQGIYPDSLMELLIFDEFQKIWPDGELHYDNLLRKVNPPDYRSIDKDIRSELKDMQEGKYQKSGKQIGSFYKNFQELYGYLKIKYSDNPTCIDKERMLFHVFNVARRLEDYSNSDFLEEEAEYLSKCLYTIMCVFVEMGINPQIYIDSVIERMEEKSLKKKNARKK